MRRVYSHLGSVRHRSDVVEYRVEQHCERLGEALRRLGFVIKIVIKPDQAAENEHPREPLTAHGGSGLERMGPAGFEPTTSCSGARARGEAAASGRGKSIG